MAAYHLAGFAGFAAPDDERPRTGEACLLYDIAKRLPFNGFAARQQMASAAGNKGKIASSQLCARPISEGDVARPLYH